MGRAFARSTVQSSHARLTLHPSKYEIAAQQPFPASSSSKPLRTAQGVRSCICTGPRRQLCHTVTETAVAPHIQKQTIEGNLSHNSLAYNNFNSTQSWLHRSAEQLAHQAEAPAQQFCWASSSSRCRQTQTYGG